MTNGSAKRPVLSFQSRVAYGHVGHSAAQFCLQRLGYPVWAIDCVSLSAHPGHGGCHRRPTTPEEARGVVDGLAAHGLLARAPALLSGYLGSAEIGAVVLETRARLQAFDAAAPYCCDPVMGDRDRGLYVAEALVPFFRDRAVPRADLITPNHFELELLAGRALPALADVRAAASELRQRGPRLVVVTSLRTLQTGGEQVATLASTAEADWLVTTPDLNCPARGAGDLFTAVFLARWLAGLALPEALGLAVSSAYAVVARTLAEGGDELALIEAQDALATPPRIFPAERLGGNPGGGSG